MQSIIKSNQKILSLTLLSVVTILAFLPLFSNGFVEWDDYYYITHNELITSFSWEHIWTWFTKPFRGLYQPLVLLSFAINYAIDGLNPRVFHLSNLSLHLINSILVYFFIRRLSKQSFVGLLTAFLFAIHPLHVESVAWATERKDTLYVLFYLLGLLYYQKFIRTNSKRDYNLVFGMLVLSLLSKGSAITFPFVLVLIDFVEKREWYRKKILWEKLPFFILAFSYGLMTFYLHYRWGGAQNHTGLETSERFLFIAYAFSLYLYKLLIPLNLSAFYPFPYSDTGGFPSSYLVYWLSFLFYFILLIYGFFKNRILFFGLGFFLSIGIFLMTVGVPIIIADRFTYLPSIGLFLLFSYFLFQFYQRIKLKNKLFQWLIVSPLLILFAILTFQQSKTWKDDFSLWNTTYQKGYKNEYIMTKRGTALLAMKEYEEAESNLNEAIKINPKHTKAYAYRAYLYNKLEKYKMAKEDFLKVLKDEPSNDFAQNSLGFIEYKLGNYEEALKYLKPVLRDDSLNFDANKNMGFVLFEQNKMAEACLYLQRAISLQKEDLEQETKVELKQKAEQACQEK